MLGHLTAVSEGHRVRRIRIYNQANSIGLWMAMSVSPDPVLVGLPESFVQTLMDLKRLILMTSAPLLVIFSEMPWEVLDGLPWNLSLKWMSPSGYTVKYSKIHWLFLSWRPVQGVPCISPSVNWSHIKFSWILRDLYSEARPRKLAETAELLTWTFAFTHARPQEKIQRNCRVQCISESSFTHTPHTHIYRSRGPKLLQAQHKQPLPHRSFFTKGAHLL